jgi:hypothetical protein
MNKNTQILLGVGILAVGGYLYWKSTQKDDTKKMVGMSGAVMGKRKRNIGGQGKIFKQSASPKIFGLDGTNPDGTANPLPQNYFNKQGSGWLRGADGTYDNGGQIFAPTAGSQKIFKNMAQPMTTQNCGHTGSDNCWS